MVLRNFGPRLGYVSRKLRQILHEWKEAAKHPVGFYNYWGQRTLDNWFFQFIQSRGWLRDRSANRIDFFSVYGPRFVIGLSRAKKKVFYSGENIRLPHYRRYRDYGLGKHIDLALSFEHCSHPKYLRFPLWLMFMFSPAATPGEIKQRCHDLSNQAPCERPLFASLVASHDASGLRQEIFEQMTPWGWLIVAEAS